MSFLGRLLGLNNVQTVVSRALEVLRPNFALLQSGTIVAARDDVNVVGYVGGVVGCFLKLVADETGDKKLLGKLAEQTAMSTVMDELFGGKAIGDKLARTCLDAFKQGDPIWTAAVELGWRETLAILEALVEDKEDTPTLSLISLLLEIEGRTE